MFPHIQIYTLFLFSEKSIPDKSGFSSHLKTLRSQENIEWKLDWKFYLVEHNIYIRIGININY